MGGFKNRTEKYSILDVVSIKQTHPNKCPVRTLYEQTSSRSEETGVEKRRKG